ncbi:MAG: penicillin acylase family protein [Chloroflexi bacterium]|nr:penicillin acylase family protein [Chloroflexota bacterium]
MARLTSDELANAIPDLLSPQSLAGLREPVETHRDAWGIPHIRATNEWDLFFAQGFITAQDRLWHMDADRYRALGRWSEFVGEFGLSQDKLLRAAGMGRSAKLDYDASSDAAKAMVDAYAAGVNAFIESDQPLPVEYGMLGTTPEPWENWHCITNYKMRNSLLGTFEAKLLRTKLAGQVDPSKIAAIMNGYPEGHLITVPPADRYDGVDLDGIEELQQAANDANWLNETEPGSNAWSISGDLTASGKPLVAGDSHRALDTPSVYYQVHLSCPDFQIIGHSVPGMPGVMHFAHNDNVAWGMTYGSADTQDLFIEKFEDRSDGRYFLFKDQWQPAEVLNESIAIRGGESVDIEITITRHGPVIAGDPSAGNGIAITDPGLIEGTRWVDSARDVMRSTSVETLHEAFGEWTDRVNNYAVADVDGNFGYLHEGKIPVRGERNGWSAVPGWTGEFEWQGYIPHDELPRTINPVEGFAVTCNQRVAQADYPYYVGLYFAAHYRADRIITRIGELEPGTATVADMATIHAERLSSPAIVLRDRMSSLELTGAVHRAAQGLLKSWDGRIDRESVATSIYAVIRSIITRWQTEFRFGDSSAELLASDTGADAHRRLIAQEWQMALENGDESIWPDGHTWSGVLKSALDEAMGLLRERYGDEMSDWTWGNLHRTAPIHPLSAVFPENADVLNPPGVSAHGDGDTPLAGSYGTAMPFDVSGISVNRYIFDPSDWTNSRWITPLGSSGHPGSKHYSDQSVMWSNVEYIPQLWDWQEIAEKAETSQTLNPG